MSPPGTVFPDEIKDIERLLGQISGYPDCCCEAYVNGKNMKSMDKRIKSNYVLCDNCEKELIEEWEKINGVEMSKENICVVPKKYF